MISNMTGPFDHEVTPCQQRLKVSWLSLAAAPILAMMALFTRIHSASMPNMLCSAVQDSSPLTGMVPMYLLMSAFHLPPWLNLISRQWSVIRRS